MDEEAHRLLTLIERVAQVARLLGDENRVWIAGSSRDAQPPGTDLDEEERIEGLEEYGSTVKKSQARRAISCGTPVSRPPRCRGLGLFHQRLGRQSTPTWGDGSPRGSTENASRVQPYFSWIRDTSHTYAAQPVTDHRPL